MVATTDTGNVTENRLFVGIKRNRGLDGILDEHKAQDVDEVREVEVVGGTEKFSDELFEKYEWFLGDANRGTDHVDEVLTPSEINEFLQMIVAYETWQSYYMKTSSFISHLIQNSYNAGNNNFIFNVELFNNIYAFGGGLVGKENNPIHVTINGDVGGYCGSQSKHSYFVINGNVTRQLGASSRNSFFVINGNAGKECGDLARYSTVVINGGIEAGGHNWAEDCIFKTTSIDDFEYLRTLSDDNQIYLIEPDGTETLMRGPAE